MNKKLLLSSLTAACIVSGSAMAVGIVPPAPKNWWYIGAGANVAALTSLTDTTTSELDAVTLPLPGVVTRLLLTTENIKRTKNNWGFNLYVGRTLNNYFAAQADLIFRGSQTYNTTGVVTTLTAAPGIPVGTAVGGIATSAQLTNQWAADVVGLFGLPVIPHYLTLFTKGGVAFYNYQLQTNSAVAVFDPTRQEALTLVNASSNLQKRNGFKFTYGAGLQLNWNQFGLRGDYTAYNRNQEGAVISGTELPGLNDFVSVTLNYAFAL